jgi:microcystin-dependent protein
VAESEKMAEPFLAEIKIVSFNYAPKGWALCNGQLLPINQNQALFALLGTTYGGNGQTTFALPDLRGRAPLHFGNLFSLGERGGEENHTVTLSELPAHSHAFAANVFPNTGEPGGNVLAASHPGLGNVYRAGANVAMDPAAVSSVGGSQAHTNMQPYLTLNFVIALQGIFPSRN